LHAPSIVLPRDAMPRDDDAATPAMLEGFYMLSARSGRA